MKNCETLEKMLKMSAGDREKTGRIVARSYYKILRRNGFTQSDIINVAGHLLDSVITDIKNNGKDKKSPVDILKVKIRPRTQEVA